MFELQSWTNEITARISKLQILQLWVGGRVSTNEEIRDVELDFLLGHHASILLRIGLVFVKLVDDDILTNEER